MIRFNTTNPPGNETACVLCIRDILNTFGIESHILAQADNRANLVARIKGRGVAPPLMLYGHVDVVTTAHQEWTYPPFEGKVINGYVWGRGALDMKGGISMMLSALLDAVVQGFQPAGDIVLVILSDEETGGSMGAGFLVDRYPEVFEGIRYALGEFGGHTTHMGSQRFYPIQISEKQLCWMKATVRGPDMHLFDFLGDVIQRIDPAGIAVPLLMPAFTDARHFARIGIQTYGFTPMRLPPEFKFSETVHGANERIPVAALAFGVRAMGDVIRHYTG